MRDDTERAAGSSICATIRFHLVPVIVASAAAAFAGEARAQSCPLSIFIGERDTVQWLISDASPICDIYRITTPQYDCDLIIDYQHGATYVSCLSVYWSYTTNSTPPNELPEYTSRDADPRLADLSQYRDDWLAAVDGEAYRCSENCDLDARLVEFYPSKFTFIGPIETIPNPEFTARFQRLEYTTVSGKKRVALTGAAAIDCLTLEFITWEDPGDHEPFIRDFREFLSALRLERLRSLTPTERYDFVDQIERWKRLGARETPQCTPP